MTRHEESPGQVCAAQSSDGSAGFKVWVSFSFTVFQLFPQFSKAFLLRDFFISQIFMLTSCSVLNIAEF